LTEPLSILQLVLNASVLVQIVLLLLLFASLTSWVMIFQRMFALRRVQSSIDAFEEYFWSGIDLRQLYDELERQDHDLSGMETVFVAGFKEYSRLSDQDADADAVMQAVQRAARVALVREEEKLETHLPFLATVGRPVHCRSVHRAS
jgi:biopolymer transport protein TolQ